MPPIIIPAHNGAHTLLSPRQTLRVLNPSGTQVIDLWAFPLTPIPTWLSTSQTRQKLSRTCPAVGDTLLDTHRKPLLTLVQDTSPGVHDLLYPACCGRRYAEAGAGWEGHASCVSNLLTELGKFVGSLSGSHLHAENTAGIVEVARKMEEWGWAPEPLNLFMNVLVRRGDVVGEGRGSLSVEKPVCGKGDYVVLRAERECLVVMSACPNDLLDTNGGKPGEGMYEVLDGEDVSM